MNKYLLKLVDDYGDIKEQLVAVETNKTLDQVVSIYNRARKKWYDGKADGSLYECIENAMEKNKIIFYNFEVDKTLAF